jgi:hypothetical protein
MAIYIIDGYSGHGKTAFAVRLMRDLLNSGERVYPDIKLFPEFMDLDFSFMPQTFWEKFFLKKKTRVPLAIEGQLANREDRENPAKRILYWSHFDEWQYLRSGTILCDEGGVKFNARRFDSLPDEIQNKLMQLRHERLDLYLTAPHQSRIDLMIRQNTEKFYHVKLMIGSPKFKKGVLPRITSIRTLHLEQVNLIGTPMEELIEAPSKIFYINPKYFNWYDTSRVVTEGRPMPIRRFCRDHTVFYCPECERLKLGDAEYFEDQINHSEHHVIEIDQHKQIAQAN